MSEQDAETPMDRDVQELDHRLGKLEEHIQEAKGKAEEIKPDPELDDQGPASEQFPPQFDRG